LRHIVALAAGEYQANRLALPVHGSVDFRAETRPGRIATLRQAGRQENVLVRGKTPRIGHSQEAALAIKLRVLAYAKIS
jgi:hypothetical protein